MEEYEEGMITKADKNKHELLAQPIMFLIFGDILIG